MWPRLPPPASCVLLRARREFGDLVSAPGIAAELLDRDDEALAVQPGQQIRAQVDLGVERVVVCDDRHPDGGGGAVVVEHRLVVGTVGVRWQQQHRGGARLRGLLDPAAALQRAVRAAAGHDSEAVRGGLDGGGDDAGAFLVAQRLVLAQ